MKAYSKAVLEVEEFLLNAEIAGPSDTEGTPGGSSGYSGVSTGVEFVIGTDVNDEI